MVKFAYDLFNNFVDSSWFIVFDKMNDDAKRFIMEVYRRLRSRLVSSGYTVVDLEPFRFDVELVYPSVMGYDSSKFIEGKDVDEVVDAIFSDIVSRRSTMNGSIFGYGFVPIPDNYTVLLELLRALFSSSSYWSLLVERKFFDELFDLLVSKSSYSYEYESKKIYVGDSYCVFVDKATYPHVYVIATGRFHVMKSSGYVYVYLSCIKKRPLSALL